MKILVTGGAGFIGSHIVDFLVMKGHRVAIVDNLITGKKENIDSQAKFYQADITQDINNIFEIEKPEVVIHAAAQAMLRESLVNPIYDAKVNILGTINVLEACKTHKVKKIIYISTGGARYGESEYLPIDEAHPINPSSPYGISKHTAEHYICSYSKLYGIEYLILCFGNVYGPRDSPSSNRIISLFSYRILQGKTPVIFGDGTQTRDFIYVLDLAEFIADCVTKNYKHNLFNLSDGKKISVNEVFRILKEISGFSGKADYVEAIKGEVKDICLDTSLAERELGWKPKHSFEEGLKETFMWFKQNLK